jgi:hypothetical protein
MDIYVEYWLTNITPELLAAQPGLKIRNNNNIDQNRIS